MREEGLYEAIPEYRRPAIFTLPMAFRTGTAWPLLWLSTFWLPEIYLVWSKAGKHALLFALLAPPLLLILVTVVLVIIGVTMTLVGPFSKQAQEAQADSQPPRILRAILLVICPLGMGLAIRWYLSSWMPALSYLMIYGVANLVFLLFAHRLIYRAHQAVEFLSSIVKVFKQTITLFGSLAPLLLILVLFPLFTRDFWEVVGNLDPSTLLVAMAFLSLPAVFFAFISLKQEANEIVGDFPESKSLIKNAERTSFISERMENETIASDEWAGVSAELDWRDVDKLASEILPFLQRRVRRWLALLLVCTILLLTIAFFIYFFTLSTVLIRPTVLIAWLQQEPVAERDAPPIIVKYLQMLHLQATAIPIAKVSLLLSTFISVMSSVFALTEESVKKRSTDWLRGKAASWLALSCVYRIMMSPKYQVWEYKVKSKRRGVANVSVVFSPDVSDQDVEATVNYIQLALQRYRKLVLVTAFKKSKGRAYRYGMQRRYWQLVYSTHQQNGTPRFTLIRDYELASHNLPATQMEDPAKIPNEWFGNTPRAVDLARAIYLDPQVKVLHPYAYADLYTVSLVIRLDGPMDRSSAYFAYVRKLFRLMKEQQFLGPKPISVYLYSGSTLNELAYSFYGEQVSRIAYRDSYMRAGKLRFFRKGKILRPA